MTRRGAIFLLARIVELISTAASISLNFSPVVRLARVADE